MLSPSLGRLGRSEHVIISEALCDRQRAQEAGEASEPCLADMQRCRLGTRVRAAEPVQGICDTRPPPTPAPITMRAGGALRFGETHSRGAADPFPGVAGLVSDRSTCLHKTCCS